MYWTPPIQRTISQVLLASIMAPFFIHAIPHHNDAHTLLVADSHEYRITKKGAEHEKEAPHTDPEVEDMPNDIRSIRAQTRKHTSIVWAVYLRRLRDFNPVFLPMPVQCVLLLV